MSVSADTYFDSRLLSFSDLFKLVLTTDDGKVEVDSIVIPPVQRDYAQGRTTGKVPRIREKFLDALYDILAAPTNPDGSAPTLNLDFVYGEIELDSERTGKAQFVPLDGQQRLTTLFLLHWYAACLDSIPPAQCAFLKNFSYAVRYSSADFCRELCERHSADTFIPGSVAASIENAPWFRYDWLSDPTVCSMMVMIKAIDSKFSKVKGLWRALVEEPRIRFYFLPLSVPGMQPEELYIKMNSRGKPLTDFEHFKAQLEVSMRDTAEASSLLDESDVDDVALKFDTTWSDRLFPYRDPSNSNQTTDHHLVRLFLFICSIIAWRRYRLIERLQDTITDSTAEEERDAINHEFYIYGEIPRHPEMIFTLADEMFTPARIVVRNGVAVHIGTCYAIANIRLLIALMDAWSRTDTKYFSDYLSPQSFESGKVVLFDTDVELLEQCCRGYQSEGRAFPLRSQLLLYAFACRLLASAPDITLDPIDADLRPSAPLPDSRFRRLLRSVRNLVTTETVGELRESAMPILTADVEDIILRETFSERTNSFALVRKDAEKEKLEWSDAIASGKDNTRAESLFRFEDHDLIRGNIEILGLENVDKFDTFRALFRRASYDHVDRNNLPTFLHCEFTHFDLINCALLCIGDFSQFAGWKFQIGHRDKAAIWRALFHRSDQRRNFEGTRRCLIDLLSGDTSYEGLVAMIEAYLSDPNVPRDWRYYLAKWPTARTCSFSWFYWPEQYLYPYPEEKASMPKNYNFRVMDTNDRLSKNHWSPYLLAASRHPLPGISLDLHTADSDGRLAICGTPYEIEAQPQAFVVYSTSLSEDSTDPSEENLIETIDIPIDPANGMDATDRIDMLISIIIKYANK